MGLYIQLVKNIYKGVDFGRFATGIQPYGEVILLCDNVISGEKYQILYNFL